MVDTMTRPESKTASGDSTANFNGNCGECSDSYNTATCSAGMQINQSATVNGKAPQNCVVGNDSAAVFQIELQNQAGPYDYQLRVQAQGPDSWKGGSFYTAYQDATGDVYYLRVFSSALQWHSINFNSNNPSIVSIYWSDDDFTVDNATANKAKAEFQAQSPAN